MHSIPLAECHVFVQYISTSKIILEKPSKYEIFMLKKQFANNSSNILQI